MFGRTDYITIQQPKIASSTLLCNTNWQPNWTEYYKLIFNRKETLESGNFQNRLQSMSEKKILILEQKGILPQKGRWPATLSSDENTERNNRKPTREIISKVKNIVCRQSTKLDCRINQIQFLQSKHLRN